MGSQHQNGVWNRVSNDKFPMEIRTSPTVFAQSSPMSPMTKDKSLIVVFGNHGKQIESSHKPISPIRHKAVHIRNDKMTKVKANNWIEHRDGSQRTRRFPTDVSPPEHSGYID
jgi:hypothetical protein